jgi:hypothetical protein
MRKHGSADIALRRLLSAEAGARAENDTLQGSADELHLHDRANRESGRLSKEYRQAPKDARESLGRAYQNAVRTRGFAGLMSGSCREIRRKLGDG